jgi:hypothetical protein
MLSALVYLVLYVVIVGLICGLLLWLVDTVGIPEPFHKVARVAIIVVGVLIVIVLLLQMIEGTPVPRISIK